MKLKFRPELKVIADCLNQLEKDGIIRSKNFVGDLGENYCRDLFDLVLNPKRNETGFDATDEHGRKIEIKTRRIPENKAKVCFKGLDFAYCLYVELDKNFEPIFIYKISCSELLPILERMRKRLSVGKLKSIESKEQLYPLF